MQNLTTTSARRPAAHAIASKDSQAAAETFLGALRELLVEHRREIETEIEPVDLQMQGWATHEFDEGQSHDIHLLAAHEDEYLFEAEPLPDAQDDDAAEDQPETCSQAAPVESRRNAPSATRKPLDPRSAFMKLHHAEVLRISRYMRRPALLERFNLTPLQASRRIEAAITWEKALADAAPNATPQAFKRLPHAEVLRQSRSMRRVDLLQRYKLSPEQASRRVEAAVAWEKQVHAIAAE